MAEYKSVDFDMDTCEKIAGAVQDILKGICSKVIINDNVKVYECTNIIRIDLKVIKED